MTTTENNSNARLPGESISAAVARIYAAEQEAHRAASETYEAQGYRELERVALAEAQKILDEAAHRGPPAPVAVKAFWDPTVVRPGIRRVSITLEVPQPPSLDEARDRMQALRRQIPKARTQAKIREDLLRGR